MPLCELFARLRLLQKLKAAQPGSLDAQIAKAYRLILNRQPIADETKQALTFLADYKAQYAELQSPTGSASLAANETAESESPAAKATTSTAQSAQQPAQQRRRLSRQQPQRIRAIASSIRTR